MLDCTIIGKTIKSYKYFQEFLKTIPLQGIWYAKARLLIKMAERGRATLQMGFLLWWWVED